MVKHQHDIPEAETLRNPGPKQFQRVVPGRKGQPEQALMRRVIGLVLSTWLTMKRNRFLHGGHFAAYTMAAQRACVSIKKRLRIRGVVLALSTMKLILVLLGASDVSHQ